MTGTVGDAYRACESITRLQARNFYYGIRLLPATKRSALCAVYALARRIDDIGDGELPLEAKSQGLAEVRASLRDIAGSTDPVLVAVADASRRFPVPLGAFDELIDGVEMDLSGRTYDTFDDLVGYCRCVAGSVGRLCLGVFGGADQRGTFGGADQRRSVGGADQRSNVGSRQDPRASEYADTLGIALQQTNILRDIREDLLGGRVYLPQRELERFGVSLALDEQGALVDKEGGLAALIEFTANRARGWYDKGLRLTPLLDRRSAACTIAMSGIYRRLLDVIAADPAAVYHQRLSLSGWQKAGVAIGALAGASR